MTAGFTFYEYIPLNFVVTFASDSRARQVVPRWRWRRYRDTGDWLDFYGVYEDEYAVFDGAWRFTRRRYRTFGRRRGGQLEAFPLEDSRLQ